jgi:hypothetical protein
LFHHDPAHTDAILDGIVDDARREFKNTCAAREGTSIYIQAKVESLANCFLAARHAGGVGTREHAI